jgi:hypothetical protein
MGKKIVFFTLIFTFLFGNLASAHPGRTDANGGHVCRTNCGQWGLQPGEYHYHNGGGSTSSSSSSININDKDCSDFATYDEVVQYWNSKGYSATYDPENLDGWGNGVVDDGIPCEYPSGYDLTKINNSPQQIQFKKDQQDSSTGENQGYSQGLNDGYQEATANSLPATGSDAFKNGYTTGYNKGYDEGNKKLVADKEKAKNEGYSLGQNQDQIVIPSTYSSHAGLKAAYEEGFNQAVSERVEAKKQEFISLGFNDGKKDVFSPPKDVKDIYIKAYEDGYANGQTELKETYTKQGYEAAFKMLEYKAPDLTNEKFKKWHKEGFESNKEVLKIQNAGLALGKEGSALKVPEEFKKGDVIFKHYYDLGYKEYEEQQSNNQKAAVGGFGVVALTWLGRRFYVARKMIK